MLLFEGGEALRFDHWAIEDGVGGDLLVLASLGMIADPLTEADLGGVQTDRLGAGEPIRHRPVRVRVG